MNYSGDIELKRIGKNIKRLRKSLGMNQTALALKAGTRPTSISMIETATNLNPGWNLLKRIADALDTNIHKLTMPSSTVITEEIRDISPPPGLVELLMHEDTLLAISEDRITLQEVQWLKQIPYSYEEMTAKDLLVFLRTFRHLADQWRNE